MTDKEFTELVLRKGFSEVPNDIIRLSDGFIHLQEFTTDKGKFQYIVVGSATDRYSLSLIRSLVKLLKNRKLPTVTDVHDNYEEMGKFILKLGAIEVSPNVYLLV